MIIIKLFRNTNITNLNKIAYLLSCFSYPITAVLILLFGLPTSGVNILLKIFYSIIYIYLLFKSFLFFKPKILFQILPLLIFFFAYSIRLIFDNSIRNIPFASGSQFYVYSYFFGATLLPCCAIIFSRYVINSESILKSLFYFLLLSNFLLFIYIYTTGEQGYIQMLAGRANVNSENETGADGVFINPILISQTGATLALLSILDLTILINKGLLIKTIKFISIILGLFNLFIGASRGPLFSFILLLLFGVFYYFFWRKKTTYFFLKTILGITILILILNFIIIPFASNNDIFLINRVEVFFDNINSNEKEARDLFYDESFKMFFEKPLLGNQFVLKEGNGYPHNIFLEVLISLGIIGIIIFLFVIKDLIVSIFIIFFNKVGKHEFILMNICLLSIILGLTSGSIFVNPDIWISLSMVLVVSRQKNIIHF